MDFEIGKGVWAVGGKYRSKQLLTQCKSRICKLKIPQFPSAMLIIVLDSDNYLRLEHSYIQAFYVFLQPQPPHPPPPPPLDTALAMQPLVDLIKLT